MVELQINHYEERNLYVVTIGGSLNSGSIGSFNKYLTPLIDSIVKRDHMRGLILDMKGVGMLDSSGIGSICGKFVRLKKVDKKLALCNVNKNVSNSFSVSGLKNTLTFYNNIPEAISILGTAEVVALKEPESAKKPRPKISQGKGLEDFLDKKI